MLFEAAVFVGFQQCDESRIDVCSRDRQAPATILCREGAQQDAVAVGDDRRAARGLREIERREEVRRVLPRDRNAGREDRDQYSARKERGSPHFASCTTSVPNPVRPKRSGRYMSSIDAGGST